MKKILSVVLVLVLVFALASCGKGGESAAGVIKIAVAGPMTGDNAEYGIGFANAAELMAKKVNAAGGVKVGDKSYTVEIVKFDDKSDTDEAQVVAERIVSDKDIIGVIGHFTSGVCMAAAPTYQDAGVINISPSASQAEYTGIGDYIFRNNTVIVVETKTGAEMAVKDLGCKKIGILAIDTEWGQTTSKAMEANVVGFGGTVASLQKVSADAVDFATEIANFKSAGVEAVMVAGMYGTLAPFAVACANSDFKVKLIGCSNAYTANLIKIAGEAANGIYAPVAFFAGDPDPAKQAYVKEYKETYGAEPSALTTQAYDSVGILIEAIARAGSLDHAAVRDALYQTNYAGMSGQTTFDKNGDAQKVFTKIMVKDGAFTTAVF